ncbi:carbamoyltransferase HypF [Jeotgalibacillus haloalkalitolerans]|uniref:Carbamoyltransferase n=1 Tax=Jeotgalibacillus haloalkalitolerans TaxID=3104292 RepID=A0ABU5KNL4_9BACL|nr:carbamoyltransferase HypF [Jeotgalibacillus sp. HH7-29]MDZ5712739.1 carbamoyltransferase HypF [Jeotgalibacillus sp. HH7-29]
MHKALEVTVKGRVQGVGFRPFIYSLATKHQLTGTVQNNAGSVLIHIEGYDNNLSRMVRDIQMHAPPLSQIIDIKVQHVAVKPCEKFLIIPSTKNSGSLPWISADAAVCDQCVEELMDQKNRRFHHPFINCTQCGPRYTIIQDLPYDRPHTTMRHFDMCPECQKEYMDPGNRRHHAQPNSCKSCGPVLKLFDQHQMLIAERQEAVRAAIDALSRGKTVAIKGIGGYHLACDALQENAIREVRKRKHRPHKPLAVMFDSLDSIKKYCRVSDDEEEVLKSPEKPIVVLHKRPDSVLSDGLSPGLTTVGVMLPYTPLHHLLFENGRLTCLVMTSSNLSGHPIQYGDRDLDMLHKTGDFILSHDRAIHVPLDDSVVQFESDKKTFIRRARGFVPDPFPAQSNVDEIIALGGQQKNTFAIGKQNYIWVGPHIGDLENEEIIHSFLKQLHHFKEWLQIQGKVIAVDQHPGYTTSYLAKEMNGSVIAVQHHHAHLVSCMEDNGLTDPVLGLILDGTGYGEDGCIWGFEFLYGDAHSFERAAHLAYTPLPGGEKAVKELWRIAAGMILHHWPADGMKIAGQLFPGKQKEIKLIERMILKDINSPMAGSCGRLFDAVSAILGVCLTSTYEGEAAIKISDMMNGTGEESNAESYPYLVNKRDDGILALDFSPMLQRIIDEKCASQSIKTIVRKFHMTIITACVETIVLLFDNHSDWDRTVVFSGGSFQNQFLTREIKVRLEKHEIKVYTHKKVPCNDGGLSLGQLIIAASKRKRR